MRFLSYLGIALVAFWAGAVVAVSQAPQKPPPKRVIVVQKTQHTSCKEAVRQCKTAWRLK